MVLSDAAAGCSENKALLKDKKILGGSAVSTTLVIFPATYGTTFHDRARLGGVIAMTNGESFDLQGSWNYCKLTYFR